MLLTTQNPKLKTRRGFSLIELIVVIAIISILTAIVSVNLAQSRAKARDAQRLTQLEQLHLAIEAYREAYGRYPVAGCGASGWVGHSWGTDCAEYIEGLSALIDLPVDPTDTTNGFIYRTDANGTMYKVMAYGSLETVTLTAADTYARYRTVDGCSTAMTGLHAKTYAIWGGASTAACW